MCIYYIIMAPTTNDDRQERDTVASQESQRVFYPVKIILSGKLTETLDPLSHRWLAIPEGCKAVEFVASHVSELTRRDEKHVMGM